MFSVHSYSLAIVFCFITMLCRESWANTQKLTGKTWRYEYFYWDYVSGILVISLIFAFTLGSIGAEGRSFIEDLSQAAPGNIRPAFLGGIVFNAANILLVAAIIINALAYRRASKDSHKITGKGLMVSILAGILMSFFYRFIAALWGVFMWREFKNSLKGTNAMLTAMFILFLLWHHVYYLCRDLIPVLQ